MSEQIRFRQVQPNDTDFLYRVFVSTRPDITMLDASDQEKATLLRTQFRAQSYHYQTHFGAADFLIVLLGKKPVGRLYVNRAADEIRVIDLAILPSHRTQGIGTKLLLDILQEGRTSDKPVRVHVEKMSRAIRLYKRLGFVTIAEKQYHWFMEWTPSQKLVIPEG